MIRVLDRDVSEHPMGSVALEDFNRLTMSKDPEGLALAALGFGPFWRKGGSDSNLVFSMADFTRLIGSRFMCSDAESLLTECFFDPYAEPTEDSSLSFDTIGRKERARSSKLVEQHDLCAHFRDTEPVSPDASVIVEPLQDWVLIRNILSISLRVASALRGAGADDELMTSVGFRRVLRARFHSKLALESSAYVMPVAFNDFFRDGSVLAYNEDATSPFLRSITLRRAVNPFMTVASLSSDRGVKFLSAVQAEQADASLLGRRRGRPEEDKWLFLAIEEREGEGPRDALLRFLNAIDGSMGRPEIVVKDVETDEVRPVYYDVPSAAWGLFRSHRGLYISTCEQCGRSMLANPKGGRKRFCSSACRSLWSKGHSGEPAK